MSDRFEAGRKAITDAVLAGPGKTQPALRKAVCEGGEVPEELRPLLAKIAQHAYKVTDEDIASLKAKYSEDELWELVVSASLGAALERVEAGLRAVEDA